MQADQAIFTSLDRPGRPGYQVVARSTGLTPEEAASLAAWCPSQGGLQADESNRVGLGFRQAPSGRFVLSRTVHGRPECSGRGGAQVYTHALFFGRDALERSDFQPFTLYRAALADGLLLHQDAPPQLLPAVNLGTVYARRDLSRWATLVNEVGRAAFFGLLPKIEAGLPLLLPYAGDRLALTEALLAHLAPEHVAGLSVSASLAPSAVRPFRLRVVAP